MGPREGCHDGLGGTAAIRVERARARPIAGRTHGSRRKARGWRWLLILLVSALGAMQALALAGVVVVGAHARVSQYGAADQDVRAVVNAAKLPEQNPVWCGIATVAAIVRYEGRAVTQTQVASYRNSPAAVSEWGVPAYRGFGPGFQADIARDSGTNPRSLAAGLSVEARGSYHQAMDRKDAWDATIHLARDLERTGQPISVFVFHGKRSVLVSAVFATGDPATDPSSITALEVGDPGFGSNSGLQWAQRLVVPLYSWLHSVLYWGLPYEENVYGTTPADPDPAVGPYTYDPGHGENVHLWIGHYVYIRPGPVTRVNADWALDQDGVVIVGTHSELPPGYKPPAPNPAPGARASAHAMPTATPAVTTQPPADVPTQDPPSAATQWCAGLLCITVHRSSRRPVVGAGGVGGGLSSARTPRAISSTRRASALDASA